MNLVKGRDDVLKINDQYLYREESIMSKKRKVAEGIMTTILAAAVLAGCGSSTASSTSEGASQTSASSEAAADTSASTQAASTEAASTETSAEASGDLEPVTIYSCYDPQLASQIIIAKDKGYFKDEGLDVDIKLIESSGDLPAYLASGEAQVVCESTYTSTACAAQGIATETLMSDSDIGGTQGVVAGPDFKVKSAKDLEGCTMGMMNGSGVYIAVRNMADELGIDWKSINVVYLSPSEQVAALANGSIDIMACWEPYLSQAVDNGGTLLFTGSDSYMPEKTGKVDWLKFYSTLQVSQDFYENHRDACVKLVRAMTKATDYINSNMEECAGIVAEALNNEKDSIYSIMQKNVYENVCDDDFAEATQQMAEYMYEMGNIDNVPDLDTYITPDILKEVLPDNATYVPGSLKTK